jgi:hypothetical protein
MCNCKENSDTFMLTIQPKNYPNFTKYEVLFPENNLVEIYLRKNKNEIVMYDDSTGLKSSILVDFYDSIHTFKKFEFGSIFGGGTINEGVKNDSLFVYFVGVSSSSSYISSLVFSKDFNLLYFNYHMGYNYKCNGEGRKIK